MLGSVIFNWGDGTILGPSSVKGSRNKTNKIAQLVLQIDLAIFLKAIVTSL